MREKTIGNVKRYDMTRKEFLQHYWCYYLVLEEKFKNTLNYVELNWQNAATFSNEYALLLQSIGAELDNFLNCTVVLPLKIEKT